VIAALDGQAGVRAELARALLAEVRDQGRRARENINEREGKSPHVH
jgi:hypothetical protein